MAKENLFQGTHALVLACAKDLSTVGSGCTPDAPKPTQPTPMSPPTQTTLTPPPTQPPSLIPTFEEITFIPTPGLTHHVLEGPLHHTTHEDEQEEEDQELFDEEQQQEQDGEQNHGGQRPMIHIVGNG